MAENLMTLVAHNWFSAVRKYYLAITGIPGRLLR
jgi:hypothetical protein